MSIFCIVDDKHVPIYRIQWISRTPHFCGEEDCCREGWYEIRLEQGESVWARNAEERDQVIRAVEAWHQGKMPDSDESSW
ncbi:MAG: hypothetical protein JW829_11470 [Pirellulales bacterium]|nr:hypothetical protein [Pirellulales bacterium]